MTILFAGTEPEIFNTTTAVGITTSSAEFDSDYSRLACNLQGSTFQVGGSLGGITAAGIRARLGTATPDNVSADILIFKTSGGQGILRLHQDTAPIARCWVLQYWSGSAWVNIGTPTAYAGAVSSTFIDVYCKIHASLGEFSWWLSGTKIATLTGNTDFFSATIDQAWATGMIQFTPCYSSEYIIADGITVGMRCATLAVTGAGTTTGWTSGTFADVDDTTVNDADFISSATANQVDTFALGNLSAAAALLQPVAVCVALRGRNAAVGPQNIQPAVHSGASDYLGSSVAGLTTSFKGGYSFVWNTDPATGIAWTVSGMNALEAGAKSIT